MFLFAANLIFAQGLIENGDTRFNAGLGFSTWGLPVYVGMDFGVYKDITVGGELSFRSYHDRIVGVEYSHSIIGIIANGNYHFNRVLAIPNEWDVYAGLDIGFYVWNSDKSYTGSGASGLGLGAQIGGRYYFNNKVGINLEVGGGNSTSSGKIGITVNF